MILKNKRALVTGGTAGIGRAIALLFVQQGADVVIIGTSQDRAASVLREMEERRVDPSQKFLSLLCDVSKTQEVEEMSKKILQDLDRVDILVNNAGIVRDNLLIRMSEEDWDSVVATNLKSVYNTCRVFARPMMKARSGKIVNVSSVIGLVGNAGQANYAASKSGVVGFTKSLAKELAIRNICVNCVAPGYIETQMTQNLPDQVKERVLSQVPLSRMGCPDDVAQAVLFLASSQADYITGSVLAVDGGMVM